MENSDHIFIPGEKKHSTQVQMLYFSAYMIAGLSLRYTWFFLHLSVSYVFALCLPIAILCPSHAPHTPYQPPSHTHTHSSYLTHRLLQTAVIFREVPNVCIANCSPKGSRRPLKQVAGTSYGCRAWLFCLFVVSYHRLEER